MMKQLLIVSLLIMLSGCAAERYFGGNGLEALVYQQKHTIEMSVQDTARAQSQLEALFSTIEDQDTGARYFIEYKNKAAKSLLDQSLASYPRLQLKNDKVVLVNNKQLLTDIKLQVSFYVLKTEQCQPVQFGVEHSQLNCFSESARLKQVANKSRITGAQ
ncbi:hypothetical protein MD535_01445 [Vibrio sp. ZSDZ65]|uniref:Lipoprotein n=1 Tax=Vibrio qingdaonensis TaxID=2829491 RepID=A0A9X3HUP3_9VIBR|nr:hypothetical protein [Vibrio qingdaonensis]MCW8344690.1 hypothetical protein [Vibrio qingdaonensis]